MLAEQHCSGTPQELFKNRHEVRHGVDMPWGIIICVSALHECFTASFAIELVWAAPLMFQAVLRYSGSPEKGPERLYRHQLVSKAECMGVHIREMVRLSELPSVM